MQKLELALQTFPLKQPQPFILHHRSTWPKSGRKEVGRVLQLNISFRACQRAHISEFLNFQATPNFSAFPMSSRDRQLQKHYESIRRDTAGTPMHRAPQRVRSHALSSPKQKAETCWHLPRAVGNLKRKGGRGRVGGSGLQCKSASPRTARLPTSGKDGR